MSYVAGYCILAGLLAWFCLVCDAREEAERGAEAAQERSGADTLG
ncbi:hypothetical protein SEA_LUCHADOR_65 [Mycobacterium phage Luchador]|uniref:Uncharacterized protein n=1 Tax=Mycobacterium phage Luchador TaxID=1647300 RepID=A0A0F6WDM5_9CAUD|nr:hypothetical protein AVT52_gp39 [Mycobacterium phage Luchador]AKF14229.1 hypothetical protein SEA_LUCHADOR_65 [Mycobacterium phage Luchador]